MGLEKARFLLGSDAEIEVQFNPSTYSISCPKQVEPIYEDLSAERGIVSGVRNEARVLNLELTFDSYENEYANQGDALLSEAVKGIKGALGMGGRTVQERLDEMLELVEVSQQAEYNGLTFAWGSQLFHGIVNSISMNYTMFSMDGDPVRANVAIAMTETPESMGDMGIGGGFGDMGGMLESLGSQLISGLSSMLPF